MPLDGLQVRLCVVCGVDISQLHFNSITCEAGCRGKLKFLRDKAYREQNKEKMSEYQRLWYEKNQEKLKLKAKLHRKANPEYHDEYRRAHKQEIYSNRQARHMANPSHNREHGRSYYEKNKELLTERRLKREHGLSEIPSKPESGLCESCGKAPKNNSSLNFDHDHETGIFRGWICLSCNRGLGLAGDDPKVLRAMAAYPEKKRS